MLHQTNVIYQQFIISTLRYRIPLQINVPDIIHLQETRACLAVEDDIHIPLIHIAHIIFS